MVNKLLLFIMLLLLSIGCSKQPEADFTINWTDSDHAPAAVYFYNTTLDGDSYNWKFGDGGKSTEKSPTHTYYHGGTYDVNLTAYNGQKSDVCIKQVTIFDKQTSFRVQNRSSRTLVNLTGYCYDDNSNIESFSLGTIAPGSESVRSYTNYLNLYIRFNDQEGNSYVSGTARLNAGQENEFYVGDSFFN
ncbi:MAG: PKD domain-containing protein [Bacteroidales bacterium]|nr:PKD domain-containing protein [Bacteroidales bacterium]